MSREQWFKNEVDYSRMLSHARYRDCDEFVVDRHGDIITYRVYGNSENNYELFVR